MSIPDDWDDDDIDRLVNHYGANRYEAALVRMTPLPEEFR